MWLAGSDMDDSMYGPTSGRHSPSFVYGNRGKIRQIVSAVSASWSGRGCTAERRCAIGDSGLCASNRVLAKRVAEGQHFIDGKRTALVPMLTFLEIDSVGVKASDSELADWIPSLGTGANAQRASEASCVPPGHMEREW